MIFSCSFRQENSKFSIPGRFSWIRLKEQDDIFFTVEGFTLLRENVYINTSNIHLMVDVNYSWPDTPHHHDPGHSDQHGNSNHTRQYLRVATLIKLATCPPQSTRLYLLNQLFWPFCSPGQPWPTQATSFCFCSWNSWTSETRPKGNGQFQEQHSVQFSQTSYAKP